MSAESVSHLRKSKNADSDGTSMYHVLAAYHGEKVAREVAERMGWGVI